MRTWIIAAAAVALATTGCGGTTGTTASVPEVADVTVASTAAAAPENPFPPGYVEAEPGLGFRWASNFGTKFECPSYAESCFGAELYSVNGCPSGVYIELALVDAAGSVIGKANEITAGLAPGDHAVVAISTTTKAPQAKVSQINCMG